LFFRTNDDPQRSEHGYAISRCEQPSTPGRQEWQQNRNSEGPML
jgi:hypothetical protein